MWVGRQPRRGVCACVCVCVGGGEGVWAGGVYQPYPKTSANISIPPKYSTCFLFIKVRFHLFFLYMYNDCIGNLSALNSFQQ